MITLLETSMSMTQIMLFIQNSSPNSTCNFKLSKDGTRTSTVCWGTNDKIQRTPPISQYMPKKPIKWGFKIKARCGESGFVYNFHVQGEKQQQRNPSIGYIGDTVLNLCESLPPNESFPLYCDRFYTSLKLIDELKKRQIYTVWTILSNRLKRCPIKSEKDLTRGECIWLLMPIQMYPLLNGWIVNECS